MLLLETGLDGAGLLKADAIVLAILVNASDITSDVERARFDSLGVPQIVPGGGRSMLLCLFTSMASAHNLYCILLYVSPCLARSSTASFCTRSAFSSSADRFGFCFCGGG